MKKKLTKREKERLKKPFNILKKECEAIAYDLNMKLIEENSVMYCEKNGKRELLCKPSHPKMLWLETNDILSEMKPHFKDYLEEILNIHIPKKNPGDK